MESVTDDLVDQVHKLMIEEAHLVSQELQDCLGRSGLQRLSQIAATLNSLTATLEPRRITHR